MAKYYNWTSHDEDIVQDYYEAPSVPQVSEEPTSAGHVEGNYPQWGNEQRIDWEKKMVFYAAEPSYFASSHEGVPNYGARSVLMDVGTSSYIYGGGGPYDYDESGLADRFSNVVHVADQPLWDGCNQSQLGVIAESVDIMAVGHISKRIYDRIFQWANRILPSDRTLSGDYYSTKKLVKDLGLPAEKIHACKNGCMLYWKDDVDLEYCKFCGDGRYKPARGQDTHRKKSSYAVLRYLSLTPRLQRLYSSRATVSHMTWHSTYQTAEGSMCHPSDAEAWKHFDKMYPDFTEEPRNVQLGLCTDGFAPHGPSNPKRLINVYLEPLIEELLQLWHVGVRMYDHARDRAFMMQAALMWTVNDLPAYGMASGWSTVGVMGCSIYAWHEEHNCHVFMQKLIPIAFREMPLEHVWSTLTEIFPPAFFDLMEHLVVHFPYEVRVGGPVQYRWMYPFERFLHELKKKVKNKAHIEASIVEAYIVKEIGMFTSQYFEPDVQSKRSMPRRNDECTSSNDGFQVAIFNYPSRASGATKKRWLRGPKWHIIETYILTNCEVVTPCYEPDLNKLYQHHHPADPIIDRLVSTEFKDWFKQRVHLELNYTDKELLKYHYWGPNAEVTLFNAYFVNGYNFQTETQHRQVNHELQGTSREQLHANDDENEDADEDSGGDDEIDDEEYETT
ncbi:hypothetical protein Sango_1879900 [Sesamum angolense]|uniref:DUF4218 domain-containing protein n=1 Tax=Sesamum angolense TaxID=2727404 RepID=A0AAE1WIT5_9LAMI|nr:hypothetical protein Sango_1879900 [Sesamum angolense]